MSLFNDSVFGLGGFALADQLGGSSELAWRQAQERQISAAHLQAMAGKAAKLDIGKRTQGQAQAQERPELKVQSWKQAKANVPKKKEVSPMETCDQCCSYLEYVGDKISEKTGKKFVMWCSKGNAHHSNLDIRECSHFKNKNTVRKSQPEKEKRPMKIKNTLRTYMLLCTVAVTGKLCVLAHPLVMLIPMGWINEVYTEIAIFRWAIVFGALSLCCFALALLNWLGRCIWSYAFGK